MSKEVDLGNLRVKMSDLEWTNTQVIQLVNEFRKRPELWDCGHDLFRVQSAKYEAYCQLSEIFHCDITDLKKKLNSVFASHRREISKIKSGGKSSWFLYPSLKFLPNHVEIVGADDGNKKPRIPKTKKSVSSDDEEEVEDVEESEQSFEGGAAVAEEIIIKEEPISVYTDPTEISNSTHRPRLRRRIISKALLQQQRRSSSNATLISLLNKTSSLGKQSGANKKDECDSFGEYIAMSLRKHDERTQSMIKQAINNILFEQEMKRYTTQYTVVVSGMEENPLLIQESDK